jgi:hypothetical protein
MQVSDQGLGLMSADAGSHAFPQPPQMLLNLERHKIVQGVHGHGQRRAH